MYEPLLKLSKTGVPVLSKVDIDLIGENFVEDFQPDALRTPQEIDIDSFVELYLKNEVQYQSLSHNGSYLGMYAFKDASSLPVYIPENDDVDFIKVKARTILIDSSLDDEKNNHRRRYTLGHEGGHGILHPYYYDHDPNQLDLFEPQQSKNPVVLCRKEDFDSPQCSNKTWTDRQWMEWQANALSAAILMPKQAVRKIGEHFSRKYNDDTKSISFMLANVIEMMNVSYQAAVHRLKDLGYIEKDDTTDYRGWLMYYCGYFI